MREYCQAGRTSLTNEQLYIVIGIPMLFNATLIGLVIALLNAKIGKLESKIDARFDAANTRFDDTVRVNKNETDGVKV